MLLINRTLKSSRSTALRQAAPYLNAGSSFQSNFAITKRQHHDHNSKTHRRVVLLGPPGVGKGTYASRASKQLALPHIAVGDAVRKEIKEKTPIGLEMKKYAESGQLVPDEIIAKIIKNRLQESDVHDGFLLDGFPRTLNQAKLLSTFVQLDLVINMQQSDHILITKIASRKQCGNCGTVYNYADINEGSLKMPPIVPKVEGVCDNCGAVGKIYQREDDREEVVRRRLEVYKQETHPLIEYYTSEAGGKILKNFMVTGGADELMPKMLELFNKEPAEHKH